MARRGLLLLALAATCSNDLLVLRVQAREGPSPLYVAMERCAESHGAVGPEFTSCVDKEAGGVRGQGRQASQVYSETLRNFSCGQDDAGSPVVRSLNITVPVAYDACSAARQPSFADLYSIHPELSYIPGAFLPAGNDINKSQTLTPAEAAERCIADPACAGFTFKADSLEVPAQVWFKSSAVATSRQPGWHTYRRRQEQQCSRPADGSSAAETRTFRVDILREEPLVALVRGFAEDDDCGELVIAGGSWVSMSRAYTAGGKTSAYRQSYSSNIYPKLRDTESELTKLVGRMFSVTRSLTGYEVYPPGQEPVNAVLYKDPGDEYRPHCDGSCDGQAYKMGERIATSIVYCHVADSGGQTSFTKGALKAVPRVGDMLLFSYRLSNGVMSGREAEHSGCPLREGKKWIATQWYREGVNEDWNWEAANSDLKNWR